MTPPPIHPEMVQRLSHADRMVRRKKIATYCRTHTSAEASAEFGVSETLVLAACRANNVKPPRVILGHTNLELVGALCMRKGVTYADLAAEYGISRQAVHNLAKRCREAGIPVMARRGNNGQ